MILGGTYFKSLRKKYIFLGCASPTSRMANSETWHATIFSTEIWKKRFPYNIIYGMRWNKFEYECHVLYSNIVKTILLRLWYVIMIYDDRWYDYHRNGGEGGGPSIGFPVTTTIVVEHDAARTMRIINLLFVAAALDLAATIVLLSLLFQRIYIQYYVYMCVFKYSHNRPCVHTIIVIVYCLLL